MSVKLSNHAQKLMIKMRPVAKGVNTRLIIFVVFGNSRSKRTKRWLMSAVRWTAVCYQPALTSTHFNSKYTPSFNVLSYVIEKNWPRATKNIKQIGPLRCQSSNSPEGVSQKNRINLNCTFSYSPIYAYLPASFYYFPRSMGSDSLDCTL